MKGHLAGSGFYDLKLTIMLLSELPAFQKLLHGKDAHEDLILHKSHIPLKKLEVVQVFHMTKSSNRESIKQLGLLCSECISDFRIHGPRIFVSTVVEELPWAYLGFHKQDIWTFCIPSHKLKSDEIQDSGNHYYIEENVPGYKLYLHESITNVYKWGMKR